MYATYFLIAMPTRYPLELDEIEFKTGQHDS